MKRKLIALTLALSYTFALGAFVSCRETDDDHYANSSLTQSSTAQQRIESRIDEFLTAYNDGDADATFACLAAKPRNAFQAALNLIGGIVGGKLGVDIDLADFFALGVAIAPGDFMGLEITDVQILSSTTALATTKMNLVGGMQNQTIYFEMVYEHGGWYINDITDKTQVPAPDQSSANISVSNWSIREGGIIKVHFTKEEETETYVGFANNTGEIFYSLGYEKDYSSTTYQCVGKDALFLELKRKNSTQTIYKLVNASGKETATSENGAFEKIIGWGEGLVLVYKNTGNITKTEHSYGVIDATSGNWVQPMTALPYEYELSTLTDNAYSYVGDGIWTSTHYYYTRYIYDVNAQKIWNIGYYSDDTTVIDGTFYGNSNYYLYYEEEEIPLPEYSSVNLKDQTFKEISPYDITKNGIFLNTENEFLQITDIRKNTVVEFKDFPTSVILNYKIANDYILLTIKGADGRTYFTLIDTQGTQQFEPIQYYYRGNSAATLRVNDTNIFYQTEPDGETKIIDFKGNPTNPLPEGYTLYGFSNGTVIIEDQNGQQRILKPDGELLVFNLST